MHVSEVIIYGGANDAEEAWEEFAEGFLDISFEFLV